MEWRPAWWSVCLPLLLCPCTIKSRSSLPAPTQPGGYGLRDVNGYGGGDVMFYVCTFQRDFGEVAANPPGRRQLTTCRHVREDTATRPQL